MAYAKAAWLRSLVFAQIPMEYFLESLGDDAKVDSSFNLIPYLFTSSSRQY